MSTFEFENNVHSERLRGTLHVPAATPGDVPTAQADGSLAMKPGGGSQPGAARVVGPFPFTFATPGLELGVDFYTPTVGDVLLDFWLETDTAWDGTSPLCDIGSATMFANGQGLIDVCSNTGPCDLGNADTTNLCSNLLAGTGQRQGGINSLLYAAANTFAPVRLLPAKFATTEPLQVVVSTDGTTSGAATGSMVGASGIYLVVATPAAP